MAHFLVYQEETSRCIVQCFANNMNAQQAEDLAGTMFPKVPTGHSTINYVTRELDATDLANVESIKAAGNMPKKGTGEEISSESYTDWKNAMELDYPELFQIPT